jgi:hypothetical protein
MILDFDNEDDDFGLVPGLFFWSGLSNPSSAVDTPPTFEVGLEYATPTMLLHYEAPAFTEMAYSTPVDMLHFDSPTA